MPTDKTVSEAVLNVVELSSYPDDEDIITAEFSSGALRQLSAKLEQARADVKDSIRELSRFTASDVDGWISQAKQLQSDIDSSQQRSRDITTLAKNGEELDQRTADAASKVSLLRNEAVFNNYLVETLQSVQQLKQTVDTAHNDLQRQNLLEATTSLKKAEKQLASLGQWQQARLVDLITAKLEKIKNAVTEELIKAWNTLVNLDSKRTRLSIRSQIQGEVRPVHLESVALGLASVDRLNECLEKLGKDLEWMIMQPSQAFVSTQLQNDTLNLTSGTVKLSTESFLSHITTAFDFAKSRLPKHVVDALMTKLVPSIVSELLNGPLDAAVPAELTGMPTFQNVLAETSSFTEYLHENDWLGYHELLQWKQRAPSVWLGKRSQSSLGSVRRLLKRGLGTPRAVERVETHRVSRKDAVFSDARDQDGWGTPWLENEENHTVADGTAQQTAASTNGARVDDGEEDVSGWGFDDDEEEKQEADVESTQRTESDPQNEEEDAWGWGDETENQETKASVPPERSEVRNDREHEAEQEVTLKEIYHVTSLPKQILEIIVMAIEDADTLAGSSTSLNPVAEAAKDLFLLPGILLSMFRASAPSLYETSTGAEMYLYNDSLYIVEQLRLFAQHRESRVPNNFLSLDVDISALELFGKRAYGREMEAQRTILADLLDGAQGFANCSESPFSQECDTAISSVIDRIRHLHQQWSAILARSALLQSIGSLLVTVTNKIIVSVEDMTDISELESQRLAIFCNRIVALDDLFLPEQVATVDPNEQAIPMTAGYTSTWLKFQYLSNILESSLVDIKYLWTEGELSLEFTADEVVDLVEALFADSDHRRRAIQEIRRAGH